MKTIRDFDIRGKRVLVRSSLNVPMRKDGTIEDDFRLQELLGTIQYLLAHKAKCIIIGHLGRPDPFFDSGGQIPKSLSLRPIAQRLSELIGKDIDFIGEPIGVNVEKRIEQMNPGDILVLENIRFYKGEAENDSAFAEQLAKLADIYINDAFAADHRAHASLVGITAFLPSGMGLSLEKEVMELSKIIQNPVRPLVAIVGGTKVATKAGFLDEISAIADSILTGNPVYDEIQEESLTFRGSEKIIGPLDGIPTRENALDIGEKTVKLYQEKIHGAGTVFWAGPLGKIEEKPYDKGSIAIAEAIVESGAFSVAGGGDLAGFLGTHGFRDKFSHVSIGGGAMLAFLAGEKLPGLEALEKQDVIQS